MKLCAANGFVQIVSQQKHFKIFTTKVFSINTSGYDLQNKGFFSWSVLKKNISLIIEIVGNSRMFR